MNFKDYINDEGYDDYKKLALIAIEEYGESLNYIPKWIFEDKEFLLEAINVNLEAVMDFNCIPDSFSKIKNLSIKQFR